MGAFDKYKLLDIKDETEKTLFTSNHACSPKRKAIGNYTDNRPVEILFIRNIGFIWDRHIL